MGDEENIIEAEREEVADEATPETDEEATEQRTDDYDGVVRRIDELTDMISSRLDALDKAIEALGVTVIETGVEPDPDNEAEELIDELMGIDALDLL